MNYFNTDDIVPDSELKQRIAALQYHLNQNGFDAALVLQATDMFYFAGTTQQGHLYVPKDAEPILMVRKSFDRARAESKLEIVEPLASFSEIQPILQRHGHRAPARIGMELDVLPVNLYRKYSQLFADSKIGDISQAIRLVRAIKSPYEIDRIAVAAGLADQVASLVTAELSEGISEVELAGKIEARARALGHQGMVRMRLWGSEMFYGHLMCGDSAAVPSALASPTGGAAMSPAFSQGPGFKPIRKNEPILFDYVFAHKGYLADHSRIFALGDLSDKLMKTHQAMLSLQAKLQSEMRPGVIVGDIYESAIDFAAESGLGDYFMGAEKQRIRFIGHGIGLELDEYPFLAKGQQMKLESGMVIALEPKVVIPGMGVVGVENTHLVTKTGLERLTHYPDEIEILE
jgi:Xaa-Pro aminopeptidase